MISLLTAPRRFLVVLFVAGLLTEAGSAGAVQRAAVLELTTDSSLDDQVAAFLADTVRGEVLRRLDSAEWQVITRENLLVMLEANAEELADCEGDCAVETGRRLDADLVIVGGVMTAGTRYRMSLKAYSTASGNLLAFEFASAVDVDALIEAVPGLCGKLFGEHREAASAPDGRSHQGTAGAAGAEPIDAPPPPDVSVTTGRIFGTAVVEAIDTLAARDQAETSLMKEATADWASTRTLIDIDPLPGRMAAEAFVETYGVAAVNVDGVRWVVRIPEADAAESWLARQAMTVAPGSRDLPPSDEVITQRELAHVVGNDSGVYQCFEDARARDEISSGEIGVRFTVGTDGTVRETRLLLPTLQGTALEACVAQRVDRLEFAPYRGYVDKMVEYSLVVP